MDQERTEQFLVLPAGMLVRWDGERLMFAEEIDESIKAYLKSDTVEYGMQSVQVKRGKLIGVGHKHIPPAPINSSLDLFDALKFAQYYRFRRWGIHSVIRMLYYPGATKWQP